MAGIRKYEIESASDWGASGTKIIDLDFKKPITQIQIFGTFEAGGTTWSDRPSANFTKVEVVDGSRVLWSGTGDAVKGHHMQTSGKSPQGYQHLRDAKSVGVSLEIDFGRYVGDRKYAFDPRKFKNPQLKITYDEDVHQTSCTKNSVYAEAYLFEENPPDPASFLRLFEVEAYTPSAGAWHEVELPTDKKVRMVYFNALKSQTNLATTVDRVKLTEDGDERVPYEDYAYKLFRHINSNFEPFHEQFRIHVATSGDIYFSHIGSIIGGTTGSYDSAQASGFAAHMGGSFKMRVGLAGEYYTADVVGYNPNGMFYLPLNDLQDDTTWFDATRLGKWELKLKGGSALAGTETIRAYVEQVHENR